METVGIIGATDNPNRYAYLAMKALVEHGHEIVLVNPFKTQVEGRQCWPRIDHYPDSVDSITIYVNANRLQSHLESILYVKPNRIIFNPGAEAPDHYSFLEQAGIHCIEACTLVLLKTNQF